MVFLFLAHILAQIRRWLPLRRRVLSRDAFALLSQAQSRALHKRPSTLMVEARSGWPAPVAATSSRSQASKY